MTRGKATTNPHELEVLLEGGSFFEGPRWHENCWYVSDFHDHHVLSVDPTGRKEVVLEVPAQPSGLGWLPDGSLLVVSMLDKRILRRYSSGRVAEHADLSDLCPGPANDMVVDRQGRAFVGNFGYPQGYDPRENGFPTTVLVCVEMSGKARIVADELLFPNGSVITPDGRTLIVGEAVGRRYTAFTITDDGSLTDRRLWGSLPTELGAGPDGCTLDADGYLWMADPHGGPCRRLAPGAITVDEIPPPAGKTIFACMLGGPDGRTLLLCAADPTASKGTPRGSAVLLTTTVDSPHAGQP